MRIWKFVFVIVTFSTAKYLFDVLSADYLNFQKILMVCVGLIYVIPSYGYAFQKIVASRTLWKIMFVLALPALVYSMTLPLFESVLYVVTNLDLLGLLIVFPTFAFHVITILAPYRYAFKSDELWAANV